MVTQTASNLVQDRDSSPTETSVLTTMLRSQHVTSKQNYGKVFEKFRHRQPVRQVYATIFSRKIGSALPHHTLAPYTHGHAAECHISSSV